MLYAIAMGQIMNQMPVSCEISTRHFIIIIIIVIINEYD